MFIMPGCTYNVHTYYNIYSNILIHILSCIKIYIIILSILCLAYPAPGRCSGVPSDRYSVYWCTVTPWPVRGEKCRGGTPFATEDFTK